MQIFKVFGARPVVTVVKISDFVDPSELVPTSHVTQENPKYESNDGV